jgi:hypothetical protein
MSAPPKPDDNLPEQEATERFNRLVGNLVKTPHQPHAPRGKNKAGEKSKKRD